MRPKIICHMVSSIDGRLESERWTLPAFGSKSDLLDIYEQVAERFNADGWMIGRKTMAYYAKGSLQKTANTYTNLRDTFIADGYSGNKVAIGLDPLGRLHYQQNKVNGNHLISILGEQVPDSYLAELRSMGISYLFAGKDGQDLNKAMEVLGKDFGIRSILLEGGALINGSFLKARLIDEISLLIYPGIDNVLVSYDGWLGDAARLYANGHDLKDPLLSPVYGDVRGFPPTLLFTGTRDLFLSNTIRMHLKLRDAGVPADLVVFEGLSHAQYLMSVSAPETRRYFDECSRFFDQHLAN